MSQGTAGPSGAPGCLMIALLLTGCATFHGPAVTGDPATVAPPYSCESLVPMSPQQIERVRLAMALLEASLDPRDNEFRGTQTAIKALADRAWACDKPGVDLAIPGLCRWAECGDGAETMP